MKKFVCRRAIIWGGFFLALFMHSSSFAQVTLDASCVKTIEKSDRADKNGPLPIYQLADKKIVLGFKTEDFEKDFIFANYIERGVSPYVGEYAASKLITFRLKDQTIEIIQKDSVGYFKNAGALSRTRALTMSDAVIATLKLHKCQPTDTYFAYINQGILSRLSADFLEELSQISADLTDWRTFSDNISFISELRLSGSAGSYGSPPGPNFTLRVRHIFMQRPTENFDPRRADARVGYFNVRRKNLGDLDQSRFDRYINKWRLDKKDPTAALSEPVKPIVFWIENTTPEKFRPYIKQGVLAWNEAFRAAGFLNAIEVYEQPVDAEWDAGDIEKNVIRWQTSYHARGTLGFAPAIYDPVTGEILGSDILLNYAGIGDHVDDWARFSDGAALAPSDVVNQRARRFDDQFNAPASSKIMNSAPLNAKEQLTSRLEGSYMLASLVEKNRSLNKHRPHKTFIYEKIQSSNTAWQSPRRQPETDAPEYPSTPTAVKSGFADRMIKEFIVQLTMHEVGHSLGLTHNFRGSHWRSMDEIYDRQKTKGVISASVMDYLPINFSPINVEQGDFANTRPGPYDVWAVEFGYRPDMNEEVRNDLLARAVKPENGYDSGRFNDDPYSLLGDLTNAPVDYAKSRLNFVSEMSKIASVNNAFTDQSQYLSLFQELSLQTLSALFHISAQVTPFSSKLTQAGGKPSDLFKTVTILSMEDQQYAIEALEQLVFSSDPLPFSEDFLLRLGTGLHAADLIRIRVKETIMSQLMDENLLYHTHRASEYGSNYSPTKLLFDLKDAVFGADLRRRGRPSKERRDQQIMFANHLTQLINNPSSDTRSSDFESSVVSAAARPVRKALLKELSFTPPWPPAEVRAHRDELRSILQ